MIASDAYPRGTAGCKSRTGAARLRQHEATLSHSRSATLRNPADWDGGAAMGRSEERTDWLGNKYIQHYDDDDNKVGTSREREDFFGNKYTGHRDASDGKIGTSRIRQDFFGSEYDEHKDQDGNKLGWSESREGFSGNRYDQHRDNDDHKVGWSERRTGWLGDKYTHHEGDHPPYSHDRPSDESSSRPESSGSGSDYGTSDSYGSSPSPANRNSEKGSSVGKKILKGVGYAALAVVVLGAIASASEQQK